MAGSIHAGHRARMRDRVIEHGTDTLATYELLEMLLYPAVPVKDTHPSAKLLLARFGGIDGVFRASREELMRVPGIGAAAAGVIAGAAKLEYLPILLAGENGEPTFSDRAEVREWIRNYFKNVEKQIVLMLSFDNKMRLIGADEIYESDFNLVGIRCEAFLNTAMRREASAVAVAHNHPAHLPFADEGDRENHRRLKESLTFSGIGYLAHYLVREGLVSEVFGESNDPPDDEEKEWDDGIDLPAAHCAEDRRLFLNEVFRPAFPDRCDSITEKLLHTHHGLSHVIGRSADRLIRFDGLEKDEAVHLRVMIALYARRTTDGFSFGGRLHEARLIRYCYARLIGQSSEVMLIFPVDPGGRIRDCAVASAGDNNALSLSMRKIFDVCRKHACKSFILAHNHPSGTTVASEEDILATMQLKEASALLKLELRAHYVIAGFAYRELLRGIEQNAEDA